MIRSGEIDIEDFRKQILTMELPSEAMRFDLLKQIADIKPPAAQPEKQKKVGRNDPCPCGSGKKYKKCGGKWQSKFTKNNIDERQVRNVLVLPVSLSKVRCPNVK